ncbi:hypothetical protein FB471_5561 [Amycolatopsis cihanbeyliensis]|uniref:DUF4352 domain-containing protein n=1 Tax=Amycolatopsis cihanbeyliensis TaxID=1128664 RepID=A0A542DRV6_AMYCI|nr:hypothetical protein FB471_5561 [Amycolatopsis cihanbeyliensis]
MRTLRPALAACLLVVATACTTPAASDDASPSSETSESSEYDKRMSTEHTVSFGKDYQFVSGITVAVSEPKSFRPSSAAYPQSDRAVSFDISLYNDGQQPYQLSQLAIEGIVDEQQAKQVVDATQGFNGLNEADKDLPPQRNVRMTVAFAVPPEPTSFCLRLRPRTGSEAAVYAGSV